MTRPRGGRPRGSKRCPVCETGTTVTRKERVLRRVWVFGQAHDAPVRVCRTCAKLSDIAVALAVIPVGGEQDLLLSVFGRTQLGPETSGDFSQPTLVVGG